MPDVGIHDPEFHVEGNLLSLPAVNRLLTAFSFPSGHAVYPAYTNTKQQQPPPIPEPPTSSTTTTEEETLIQSSSTTPSTTTTQEVSTSTTTTEENEPLVEAKSQEIELKNDTALFVPDDDVIIETPSATELSSTTSTVAPSPPLVVSTETNGFIPVVNDSITAEEIDEQQTEIAPQLITAVNSSSPQIDTAPWKPITSPVIVPADPIEARFIDTVVALGGGAVQSVTDKSDLKISSTTTTISPIQLELEVEEDEAITQEEESTEFALTQDVGNMAMLVPEDRVRSSSSASPSTSSTTFPTLGSNFFFF